MSTNKAIRTAAIMMLGLISTLLVSQGSAQEKEIKYHKEAISIHSGIWDGGAGSGTVTVLVFSDVVMFRGAPWLRLHFGEANLGRSSYIVIESVSDGSTQHLVRQTLEQWRNLSAYFNGDAVRVSLFADPQDTDVFFIIDEAIVGEKVRVPPILSLCRADDRIPSSDAAVGRLLNPLGCTGWISTNGNLVTAGHCLDDNPVPFDGTLEFNVPPSLPDGTIQHPEPADQYTVDSSSLIFVANGVGDDWGVFQVFPNSQTGLLPREAQGASLASALEKLSAESLSNLTPHSFYVKLHHSHPPLAERLDALRA